jgi:hypothetical protein
VHRNANRPKLRHSEFNQQLQPEVGDNTGRHTNIFHEKKNSAKQAARACAFETSGGRQNSFLGRSQSSIRSGMSYAYLFKYIIIGDTGALRKCLGSDRTPNVACLCQCWSNVCTFGMFDWRGSRPNNRLAGQFSVAL